MINNKQIAEELEKYKSLLPEECPANSERMIVTIDGLTLKFLPSQKALMNVVNKLRKNKSLISKNHTVVSTLGPRALFKQFCADGETENAINLATLKGLPIIFSGGKKDNPNFLLCVSHAVKNHGEFVVGRIYNADGELQPWEVYHVPSGMSCSSKGTSKEASLMTFESIPADKLKSAVKSAADRSGFQQQAFSEYVS